MGRSRKRKINDENDDGDGDDFIVMVVMLMGKKLNTKKKTGLTGSHVRVVVVSLHHKVAWVSGTA